MRHFSTWVSSIVESTTCSSPLGLGSRRPLDTGMELPSNHVTTRFGTSTFRALRGMHGIVPERPLNIYSKTISASRSMKDRRVLGGFVSGVEHRYFTVFWSHVTFSLQHGLNVLSLLPRNMLWTCHSLSARPDHVVSSAKRLSASFFLASNVPSMRRVFPAKTALVFVITTCWLILGLR